MRSPFTKVLVLSLIWVVLPWRCYATTVVVFVTPYGIVMGADSKPVTDYNKVPHGNLPTTDTKIFLIGGRFIISHVGLGLFTFVHEKKPKIVFRFQDCVAAVKKKITRTTSVFEVASLVQEEVTPKMGEAVEVMISHKWISPNDPSHDPGDFLVAGYEGGAPAVYDISFKIDWKRGALSSGISNALQTNPAGFGLRVYGASAISQIPDPHSKPHEFAFRIAPIEMGLIMTYKPVTLKQAITSTRVLIETESKFTPTAVGLPAKVFVVEPPTVARLPPEKQKHNRP